MIRAYLLRAERGQALIVVALSMVGLIAMLALILDGGNMFVQRRRMQNAADAGAIAGTRELALASTDEQVYNRIKEYTVIRNGADDFKAVYLPGGQIVGAGVVPPDASSVQVAATTDFPTYFAGVVGITAMSAGAEAEGGYSAVKATWGLWPIALKEFDFEYDATYAIWDSDKIEADPNSGVIVGGHRGWLNFNGHDVSNAEIKEWMEFDYQGQVTEGDWVNGSPGTRTAAAAVAEKRINDIVIIPVYDAVRPGVNGNGKVDYHIISFAAFNVEGTDLHSSIKKIFGQFRRYVKSGEWGGTEDDGVRVVRINR